MEVKNIEVFGWENAIRGMRFPKNSEDKMDSGYDRDMDKFILGNNDRKLFFNLSKAGTKSKSHRKMLRMIHIQCSINMPISWWIQMDTYKIATTANSRSRMHKMGSRLLNENDFYIEKWGKQNKEVLDYINLNIIDFQETNSKTAWRNIIDILPMSYQQERMWDANYEVLMGILKDRYYEKLQAEWRYFCNILLDQCQYLEELYNIEIGKENG